jgi:5'-nucleotidase
MKILIVNDDGIHSRGIAALAKALREIGEVFVVAPLTEQSAVGHSITMKIPLRVHRYFKGDEFFGYAVEGTPADCVKMGIRNILKETPDIVISGINNGSNAAINVIYSGTVSAAREAAIMNIPSFAISVDSHNVDDFSYAAEIAKKFARIVTEEGLPSGTLLNINVPNLPKEQIKGIKVTRQSMTRWDDHYEERIDPYGKKYYWLTGDMDEKNDETEEYDHYALKAGYVSVTPIHFDLTDYSAYEKYKDWQF